MGGRRRAPDPCAKTGYPKFQSATEAWKAGNKIIRHPLDTVVLIDKCDFCHKYHFLVKDRRNEEA